MRLKGIGNLSYRSDLSQAFKIHENIDKFHVFTLEMEPSVVFLYTQ